MSVAAVFGPPAPEEPSSEQARVLPFATIGSGPTPSQKRLERAAQIVQDAVASSDDIPTDER